MKKMIASPLSILPYRFRKWIYINSGMIIGKDSIIGKGFQVDFPERVYIGQDSLINYNCSLYLGGVGEARITIGDRVQIGYETKIICASHEIGSHDKRAGERFTKSVTIGDGCWIGANVTILPGVTISDGCVIGAGAVVIRDCEPNCLYAGIPACKVKELF